MKKIKEMTKLVLEQTNRQTGKPADRLTRLGQSILEYAVLLAIVSAAFIAMSFYVKRAVQGKIYAMEGLVTGKSSQTTGGGSTTTGGGL